MRLRGHCYCGQVRYVAEGDIAFRGQCHCRECQYISGGSPNVVIGMPTDGFSYTATKPAHFRRTDIDNPVTREFCANCGTHIATRVKQLPQVVILKVGTLDDPTIFGKPDQIIYTIDAQSFHHLPAGIPAFERLPPRH